MWCDRACNRETVSATGGFYKIARSGGDDVYVCMWYGVCQCESKKLLASIKVDV